MSRLSLRFSLLVAMFCLPFLFAQSVSAGAVTSVKTFSVGGWSQGATLTKKYFVYTDWNGSSFKVVRCNRPSGNKCKSSAYFSGKPSSMYYGWNKNTEYVQAILKENSGMICLKLSTMKKGSGCGSMVKSSGLSVSGDIKGARQGWVKYDKYYLRGYGNNGGMQNYIWLFNSSKKLKKKWPIPLSGGEVEDVMVDGDTGQVWFTWYGSSRHITYYKVSESVSAFSVIKPLKDSSSNNNSGGSSGGNSSSGGGSSGGSSGGNSSSGGSSNSSGGGATHVESNYDGSISTILFGDIQDDGNGCGVYMILNLILDILTYGVGIAAIIGISISGITYLTAKGNEQQTIKAKRRIYEIVIGLVAYAALYAALNFLMPGGKLDLGSPCSKASSTSTAVTGRRPGTTSNDNGGSSSSSPSNPSNPGGSDGNSSSGGSSSYKDSKAYKTCMKKAAKVVRTKICKIEDPAARIAETARLLAWSSTASPYKKRPPSLYNKVKEEISFTGNAKSCSGYVGVVLEASGLAPGILKKGYNTACIDDYLKNPKSGWKNIKQLKNKKPRSGDVAVSPKPCGCKCNNPGPGHTLIYLKNKSGKLVIAEANLNVYYGAIKSGIGNYHRSSNFKIYRYVGG